jgi:5-methylcytosine-specific restriction endonuclease McrA
LSRLTGSEAVESSEMTPPEIPPPEDDYPLVLEQALEALAAGDVASANQRLEPIAYRRTSVTRPRGLKRRDHGRVFRRDGFRCRYCGACVIPIPIMELVGTVFDQRFPYHPNWKGGETHPAVLSRTAVIDHVEPASLGGPANDENLVTACWPCNARKADLSLARLGWALQPAPSDERWDGLTRFYRQLWQRAGRPNARLHREWASALGVEID